MSDLLPRMDWELLKDLSPTDRDSVLGTARHRHYAKGEVVFHEGDPAHALHLVETGHMLVHLTSETGERTTLNVLSPGDTVGELALVDDQVDAVRSATVTAIEPCTSLVLSASDFHDLCTRHPAVRDLLIRVLADRVRLLSDRLLEASRESLDRRLYRRLLELDETFNAEGSGAAVPLTQEQLADLVGGTRPTVNQVLRRLGDQQIIELGRGKVFVRDRATLRRKAAL